MTSEARSPSSDVCPSFDELQAFNRGQLEVEALDSISRHLQSCERCALAVLSVSEAASAEAASAEAASAAYPAGQVEMSTPSGHAGPTHLHPSHAVDRGATVSLAAESGPATIGRYAVLRVLGRGGFGIVYLARDAELGRLVAVKAPHAERIKRPTDLEAYRREARLHAGIDHVHVVPIYDVGTADEAPFFVVSKFVPGIDLAARLRAGTPDFRTSAEWVATLAEALDHVHRQGIIHRDVKPRNAMVDPAGRVYLMDFGLAKQSALHTGTEPIVGTPAYMAPEQVRGEPLDGRCDVYALGMVLYELLTGQRPFRGDATSIMQQVLTTEPSLPRSLKRNIPRDLEAICVKALAKDRERRYRTAADLAEDLRSWLRDEPLRLARRVGPLERAWSWTRRHRAVAALGAVACLALALSGFAFLRPRGAAGPTYTATVQTTPAGAEVHYFPLNPQSGGFDPTLGKRGQAGATVELTAGYHLVVAVLPDGRFHEVFRFVPADGRMPDPWRHHRSEVRDGVIHLRPIEIPEKNVSAGLTLVPGTRVFSVMPGKERGIADFYLDTKEVSVDEFKTVSKGFRLPEDAPVPPPNWPITHVTWDDAVAYAEITGKRLPDEFEFIWVASEFGRMRIGDTKELTEWSLTISGQPDWDRVDVAGKAPIRGLRSNALEWTGSWGWAPGGVGMFDPMHRVVCGGPESALGGPLREKVNWGVYHHTTIARPLKYAGLGFRCARSAKPRTTAADFALVAPAAGR